MKKVVVFFILTMTLLVSCSNKPNIVGTWTDRAGYSWVFSSDSKLKYDVYVYDYEVIGDKLIFENEDGYGLQVYDVLLSSDKKTLVLTRGKNFSGWSVSGPGWSENKLVKK
jgi:hypothetical protein